MEDKDYRRMLRRSFKKCPHPKVIGGNFIKCHQCKQAWSAETASEVARETDRTMFGGLEQVR